MAKAEIAACGVLFDFDGVVIDSENLYYRAYSEVLAEFGVSVTPEVYGREWIASGTGPEYAVRTFGLPVPPDEIRSRKNPIFHRLLRNEVELMPGAVAALERLKGRFPIALATNARQPDVTFVMEKFGLAGYFDDLITRDRYESSKPAPDAFATAAAALGLPPKRCVVIEDAWKGVKAAHVAGCRIVAIPHALTAQNDFSLADRVLDSIDELTPELIRSLVAGAD